MLGNFRDFYLSLTVFITGAAVLVIEILGTRVLSPYYGATLFVWSSLISVTLGFLALGYAVGGKLADRKPDVRLLYVFILLAGMFLLLILHIDTWILLKTDFLGARLGPLLSALVLFAPPLFCLGTVSPLVIKLRTHTLGELGVTAGNIYAIGTIGSLVGALTSGFLLVPYFAISTILTATALTLIGIAILWFLAFRKAFLQVLAVVLISGMALTLPYYNVPLQENVEILHKESGFFGTIKVYRAFEKVVCIMIDNFSQSCWHKPQNTSAWAYTRYIRALENHFPEERRPLSILVLGLGGGSIIKEWSSERHSIDVVEINPRILALAEEYIGLPGKDEGVEYILQDARYFVRHAKKKYDIITMDIVLGEETTQHLSTREFFEDVKGILRPDGIFSMQTKGGLLTQKLQPMLYKTLASVFDDVKLTAQDKDAISSIVYYASDRPVEYPPFLLQIPFLAGKEIWQERFDLASLPLITDDYNPTFILNFPALMEERSSTVDTFGQGIFLHDPTRAT